MKSFVSTLSAFAIALFLVGCGGAPADPPAGPAVDGDGHAEAEAGIEEGMEHEEAAPAEGEEAAPAEAEKAAPAEAEEAAPAEAEEAAE